MNLSDFSVKKLAALELLAGGESVAETAREIGRSRRTIHNWLREPEFAKALASMKEQMLKAATSKLRRAATLAVDTLARIAEDDEQCRYPGASVSAARAIIELAIRSHETEELEARLAKLEGDAEPLESFDEID